MNWAKILAALFDLLAIARAWLARQAGIDAERARQAEADKKAAEVRGQVEDETSKMSDADRRRELGKWVSDG